jgi:hypothetical protein
VPPLTSVADFTPHRCSFDQGELKLVHKIRVSEFWISSLTWSRWSYISSSEGAQTSHTIHVTPLADQHRLHSLRSCSSSSTSLHNYHRIRPSPFHHPLRLLLGHSFYLHPSHPRSSYSSSFRRSSSFRPRLARVTLFRTRSTLFLTGYARHDQDRRGHPVETPTATASLANTARSSLSLLLRRRSFLVWPETFPLETPRQSSRLHPSRQLLRNPSTRLLLPRHLSRRRIPSCFFGLRVCGRRRRSELRRRAVGLPDRGVPEAVCRYGVKGDGEGGGWEGGKVGQRGDEDGGSGWVRARVLGLGSFVSPLATILFRRARLTDVCSHREQRS